MGENLEAGDRLAVRTPMQWSPEKNGGFSNAPRSRLSGQPPEGAYGPEFVNVTHQQRDPDSLLNFVRRLAGTYRDCPELGWGTFEVLEQPNAAVLAHRCSWDDASLIALHNLGPDPAVVPLALGGTGDDRELADLLQDGTTPVAADGSCELTLDGYGYRWLRLARPHDRRLR